MKSYLLTIGLLYFSFAGFCQSNHKTVAGIYSDQLGSSTRLVLRKDRSFTLNTVDELFPYTFEMFNNVGTYEIREDSIILNPTRKALRPEVLIETKEGTSDTLSINLDYQLDHYADTVIQSSEPFNPKMLTIYINKKKNYTHLVQEEQIRSCLFATRIKNQMIVEEHGAILFSRNSDYFKEPLRRIGVYSYGFDKIVWFEVAEETSEITIRIHQPVEANRMPMSRELIIKGNKLYYYKQEGEVRKFLTPLIKAKDE